MELGKGATTDASRSGTSRAMSTSVFMADAILSGRSTYERRATPRASSVRSAEGGASTNVEGPRVEADRLDSDVAPEDVNKFLGGHTHVETMADRSDHRIVIPGDYNLLLNSE